MDDLFDRAKELLDRDEIKLVSFDLFDTLVLRPVLSGKAVLHLLCWAIEAEYGICALEARLSAAVALGDPCADLRMIWNFVAEQLGFSPDLAEIFAEKEFQFEKKLLTFRGLGRRIFDYAAAKGRKIIVVSDMYFSSAQLTEILEKCGYQGVSKVYVSCACGGGKRTGALFDFVMKNEQIAFPGEMLHIGDSKKADVAAPMAKGIRALHLPKNRNRCNGCFGTGHILEKWSDEPYESILYGFAVNRLMERLDGQKDVGPLCVYTHLVVFPMLLHVALDLLTEPRIQERGSYHALYFASRDGALTKKAYDILAVHFPGRLDPKYLRISRIVCRTLVEESFFDRLKADFLPESCTLREFLVPTVTDQRLREKICAALSERELSLQVRRDPQRCAALLDGFRGELEEHHMEKRRAARQYYSAMFADAPRVLIADCGFSGTISNDLMKAFRGMKKFDKAFFWENEKNKKLDEINGTTTYTAFTEKRGYALGPLVESIFSEQGGSCIGFSACSAGVVEPLFEERWQPEKMMRDIAFVQETALDLVQDFADLFGALLPDLKVRPLEIVMEFIQFFQRKTQMTSEMFANIFFKESYQEDIQEKSLGELMTLRSRKDGKTAI